jgi:AAA15 family ATPase/GTPase
VRVREIEVLHEVVPSLAAGFPLWWESDGVRRFLHLLPELYRLRSTGGVFVIDEFERSMHPMLARKFIEFFLKAGQGTASQLIFTTHETNLLDLDLMRRDGIWFAEKDNEGATQLYSLADFKVRNDLRIEKGYLQGRFGAIPFLGGIDRLIEEQAAAGAGE